MYECFYLLVCLNEGVYLRKWQRSLFLPSCCCCGTQSTSCYQLKSRRRELYLRKTCLWNTHAKANPLSRVIQWLPGQCNSQLTTWHCYNLLVHFSAIAAAGRKKQSHLPLRMCRHSHCVSRVHYSVSARACVVIQQHTVEAWRQEEKTILLLQYFCLRGV